MSFEWLALDFSPYFALSTSIVGVGVLILLALPAMLWLVRAGNRIVTVFSSRLKTLIALCIASAVSAAILILHFSISPMFTSGDSLLLGFVPMALAALMLPAESAAVVGCITGLAWGALITHRLTQPLELMLLAYLIARALQQRYKGFPGEYLRQPAVSVPLITLIAGVGLALVGMSVSDGLPVIASLDRSLNTAGVVALGLLIASGLAGLMAQFVKTIRPAWLYEHDAPLKEAPWTTSFGRRITYTFASAAALIVIGLITVISFSSYRAASGLVQDQMVSAARNAGRAIPFFFQTGRSLIHSAATGDVLASGSREDRQAYLKNSLPQIPYFEQLMLLDQQGRNLGSYPAVGQALALSDEDLKRVNLAVTAGAPADMVVYTDDGVFVDYISPAFKPESQQPAGVLFGRARLDGNPTLITTSDILKSGLAGSGEGFIVDASDRILFYPAHPEIIGDYFALDSASPVLARNEGQVFQQIQPDGTGRLVYILPIAGRSDWSVVSVVPNQTTLSLAVQMAAPAVGLLLGLFAVMFVLVTRGIQSITASLENLLTATHHIREGQLDRPVLSAGNDEIGQLGQAFEQMRLHLKHRLAEQDLLLRVSSNVSASMELFRAIPPILSGALDATSAQGVRIALRRVDKTFQTYAAGDLGASMAALDHQLLDLVEKQGTVVISHVLRASATLDISGLTEALHSLVAIPLRSENNFYGILWLAFREEHTFEDEEMTFLTTLAGQAAIAANNARLFADAEEGRRKLEAVLESTPDGMIVTDTQGHITLMNPAAEEYLGVRIEKVRGRKASEALPESMLGELLADMQSPATSLEMVDSRHKTLLASVSVIMGQQGKMGGRVAVLRDITALKELDNIKTVFLRMVSHDLRSPLTYMKGYLSMLPVTGELNAQQQESLVKINNGISHISEMTERLLYLSRLQFGDRADLEMTLVDVDELIEEVLQGQESAARDKEITLKVEITERLPLVLLDGMLFQQAVSNLVANSIKYTPDGGEVVIRAFRDIDHHLTISVSDNGIGIRPDDQPSLFDAFFRVPQREGEPPRPRGTGLGLALVKAIAEAHEGTVGIESKFGKGSKFRITVPIREAQDL
jgi:PAS domain S-box-containing protein